MVEIQSWWKDLDGLTLEEAQALAKSHGYTIRARVIDGSARIGTMDYRLNRINVSITNGKVQATPIKIG